MSNISQYLAAINSAIYGKDVRGAIHDAIETMNEENESFKNDLEDCKEDITYITDNIDDVVDRWLDEHPEATTTVLDASITLPKLVPVLQTQLSTPVNVLSLGCDNTGVNDCSVILNNYSGSSPLYFPAGKYLILNTFNVKVPIIGDGYARRGEQSCTTFIQGSNANPVIKILLGDENTVGNIYIRNINISMRYDGNAVEGKRIASTYSGYSLDHVSIYNLQNGIGLYFSDESGSSNSRGIYMSDIFINGLTCMYDSTGIYMAGGNTDCQFNTLEIMGVRCGIRMNYVMISNFENVHIWTGVYGNYSPSLEAAAATRGIYLENNCMANFSNLYTDTCCIPLALYGKNNILSIDNYTHWDDGSLDDVLKNGGNTFARTGGLVLGKDLLGDGCSVNITNAVIKMPDYFNYLSDGSIMTNIFGDVRFYVNDYESNKHSRRFLYSQEKRDKHMIFQMPTSNYSLYPLLMIWSDDGTDEIVFNLSTITGNILDTCTINVTHNNSNNTITVNSAEEHRVSGTLDLFRLYYKVIGGFVVVYAKLQAQSSSWNLRVSESLVSKRNFSSLYYPYREVYSYDLNPIGNSLEMDPEKLGNLTAFTYTT